MELRFAAWVFGVSLAAAAVGCTTEHREGAGGAGGTSGAGGGSAAGSKATAGSKAAAGSKATAGSESDAGATSTPSDSSCNPRIESAAAFPADDNFAFLGAFLSTDDGIVRVAPVDAGGYQVTVVGANAGPRQPAPVLWPGERATADTLRIAVSNDVLAIVEQVGGGVNERLECRFALASLSTGQPLQAPTRFSDRPNGETILNEALACDVATLGDGFLVVWEQYVNDREVAASVFAQRIARDGQPRGDRLTLAEGLQKALQSGFVASNGDRALVLVQDAKAMYVGFAIVDQTDSHVVPLQLPGVSAGGSLQLRAAHEGFLAQSSDNLWVVDRDGKVLHGPLKVDLQTTIAPLGTGYVRVDRGEFLTATTLNAKLEAKSKPLGLSENRNVALQALVGDASGDATFALLFDEGEFRSLKLACGDAEPTTPGPKACREQTPLEPLDDGCTDAVCHVLIRLDLQTLAVRGWAVRGGPARETSQSEAAAIASDTIKMNSEYAQNPPEVGAAQAGLYLAYVSPSDFGAFVLVAQSSGVVVAAGGVVWAGRGNYWIPDAWKPAADLACGSAAAKPAAMLASSDTLCASDAPPPPTGAGAASSAAAALDVALRTNLAASVAARGPFSAYAYAYLATVGACDPRVAEYLVVLTQSRK